MACLFECEKRLKAMTPDANHLALISSDIDVRDLPLLGRLIDDACP
jgi:hypothetical protein